MNNSKKELLLSIKKLESQVRLAKYRELEHRSYLVNFKKKHPYFLMATVFSSFLVGWQSGKKARAGKFLKHFTKYSFLTLLNLIRNTNKLL